MDKTDIEILWTLKKNERFLNLLDMVKINDRLTSNQSLKSKLRLLSDDDYVEINPNSFPTSYRIKRKGINLIWNGQTWKQIFNLIQLVHPEKYTGRTLARLVGKKVFSILKDLEYLKSDRKYIDERNEGLKKYFILSERGESYNPERQTASANYSPTLINQQVNIGNINITNITNILQTAIEDIDKSDLDPDDKKEIKTKLQTVKNTLKELHKTYGPTILSQVLPEGIKSLFSG